MRGVNRDYLQSYLDEFCWRHNSQHTRLETFPKIIESLAHHYPAGSVNTNEM